MKRERWTKSEIGLRDRISIYILNLMTVISRVLFGACVLLYLHIEMKWKSAMLIYNIYKLINKADTGIDGCSPLWKIQ